MGSLNNILHTGDNLELMRDMLSESVDLVATDPPFNTGKDWGEFDDRWDGLKGYLKFMESRIREIHRLLKSTGSFYLHCDPTASHYLKVLCDTIFGIKQFRNEIVWNRRFGRCNDAKSKYATEHDNILFYTKSTQYTFNTPYLPLTHEYIKSAYRHKDKNGRRYKLSKGATIRANGKDTITYLDTNKGKLLDCVWIEGLQLSSFSEERIGYPTQKPLALYQRIIKASSNEGDLVLDPFCGSGTTLVAAKHLFRKYIGIDQNPKAVEIAERRLNPPQQDIPF